MLQSGGDTFFWRDLTYQVKIKSEDRVILDHVSGWVKPGQVTALMGLPVRENDVIERFIR